MRNKLSIFILLLITFLFQTGLSAQKIEKNGYSVEITKMPEWATRLEISQSKKIKPRNIKDGVRYEVINKLINHQSNQKHYFQQTAYTPIKQNGLSVVSEISLEFNPDYQELQLHYINVIREGEVIDKLNADDINLIRREEGLENQIYDGVITLSMQLRGIQINDVVDYAFSVIGQNPIYEDKIFGRLDFGWAVPVEKIRVGVFLPNKKIELKIQESNLIAKRNKTKYGYFYEVLNDSAEYLESETDVPAWYNPYPWLQYSEFTSWADVAKWADGLFNTTTKMSSELQSIVANIESNFIGEEARILEAARIVQEEVRYFGIEIGVNSHKPHPPNIVFERKYGDCKDKTVLLNSILRAMGIKASPALVSTRDREYLDVYLPTPNAFDHVISKIYLAGKAYWIDGTQLFQAGNIDEYDTSWFRRSLTVEADTNSLEKVEFKKITTSIEVKEQFKVINLQGDAHLAVTSIYRHGNADYARSQIAERSFETLTEGYLDFYSRLFSNAQTLSEASFTDDKQNNIITIVENYFIEDFLEDNSEGSISYNIYASQINDYSQLPNKLKRDMPLSLSFPVNIKQRVELSFFEDIEIIGPNSIDVKNPYFTFSSGGEQVENGVTYDFNFRTHKDHVAVGSMKNYIKDLKKVNDAINMSYYYKTQDFEKVKNLQNEILQDLLND